MYQKRLREGQEVYFRYAPPQAFRHESSLDKLPKPPFHGAAAWQCSVYYYWFLFYRELQPNIRPEEIHELLEPNMMLEHQVSSFFQVRSDIGFLDWWIERGRYLFCEPTLEGVTALTDLEIDTGVHNDRRGETRSVRDPHIYLKIPVHQDFEKSIEEIRRFLRQAKQVQQRLIQFKDTEALFPVFTKPVLSSLEKTYRAWKLRKTYPEVMLSEIAVQAGLAARIDNSDAATRAANASAASRALKQAELIIEWVGRGVFPVTSQAQAKDASKLTEAFLKKLNNEVGWRAFHSENAKKTSADLRKQAVELGLDLNAIR